MEAKRYNFTNNAATIRIFVKGLKNTQTLAARVYEKGPQTQTDAISKVEKLQAAQQLTATLLPSFTVNVMSNEGDQCFQWQELGHITCNCPNVHCFECDEYGHIAADCPIEYHHQAHLHTTRDTTQGIMPDQLLDTTTGTGTYIAGQDHSHTLIDIKVTAMIIHAEVIPDHPHVEVYQPIPEIIAGPDHAHHISQVKHLI